MPSILDADNEHHKTARLVNELYHHILYRYIAEANRDEVRESLYKFFKDGDVAVISKPQLRVYQELEKLTINNKSLIKE